MDFSDIASNFDFQNFFKLSSFNIFVNFSLSVPTGAGFEPLKLRSRVSCSTSALPQVAAWLNFDV
jgi:hypothetical protein